MRLGTHILLLGGHEILVNRPLRAMSLMCEPLKGGSESDNVGIDLMYPDHTRIIQC